MRLEDKGGALRSLRGGEAESYTGLVENEVAAGLHPGCGHDPLHGDTGAWVRDDDEWASSYDEGVGPAQDGRLCVRARLAVSRAGIYITSRAPLLTLTLLVPTATEFEPEVLVTPFESSTTVLFCASVRVMLD